MLILTAMYIYIYIKNKCMNQNVCIVSGKAELVYEVYRT